MKITVSIAAVMIALGAPAFAGSIAPVVPVAPIAPAVAPVVDWSGFYIGGSYGADSGTMGYTPGSNYTFDPATSYGGFAGYNLQNGAFVYGAEVWVGSTSAFPSGFPAEGYDYMADLKLRAGYAMGDVMVYGFAGGSMSQYTEVGPPWQNYGYNIGVGVDVKITGNMFAGVEYIRRDMTGDTNNPGQTQNTILNSVQARVGWKF